MVKITKEEAEYFRKRIPSAHIAIVNKQSGHKQRYIVEDSNVLKTLCDLRGISDIRKLR